MAALALLSATFGCAGDSLHEDRPGTAACAVRLEGSRWAWPNGYLQTASYGRGPEGWLHEVGGLAVGDSIVYVYDAPEARVIMLDHRLRQVGSFGRRGSGPGELRPVLTRGMLGPQWQWLALSGDTVVVFDGVTVQRFAVDGRFIGSGYRRAVERGDLNEGSPVIAQAGDDLLSSGGGYYLSSVQKPSERYAWHVLRHSPARSKPLFTRSLAPLPERRSGIGFQGPTQARPLWTASHDCVFASDGAGSWLAVVPLSGGATDTLRYELPDLPLPQVDREELGRLAGMATRGAGSTYLEPTALLRISAIVADPDGYIWILPAQDTSQLGDLLEVLRISPATGAAERDTVPAFPLAFGPPGVFYARGNDRFLGEAHVARYDFRQPTSSVP